MKFLNYLKNLFERIDTFSEKFLKLRFLSVVGIAAYFGLIYYSLFILPQKLNLPEVFLILLLGSAALLYETRTRGRLISIVLITVFFFLPITWIWRGIFYDYGIFAGIFPLNDSNWYLTDALRLLNGLNFTEYSTRRPIYAGMLAFFMWISGRNLFFAIGVFCVLTGLSVAVLVQEIRKIAGPMAAALVLVVDFYYILMFQGQILTENIGLGLGALALAILLRGTTRRSPALIVLGVFSLTVALNARAGAMLVLPAILVWLFIQRREFPGRFLVVWAAVAVAAGFALNLLLTNLIGNKDGLAFSNFSLTLYGLAAGYKGWVYVYSVHPGVTESQVFQLAFDLIKSSPMLLIQGLTRSILDYLRPSMMISYLRLDVFEEQVRLGMYLLTWLGLSRMWRHRKDIYWSLGLLLFAGCLLSMAFLPPRDTLSRPLAVTISINALAAGFVFFVDQKQAPAEGKNKPLNLLPEICMSVLLVIVFAGPLLVSATAHLPETADTPACPAGYEKLTIDLFPGSYMNVVSAGGQYAFLPNVRQKDVTRISRISITRLFPAVLEEWQALDRLIISLRPGDSFLMGITHQDLVSKPGPYKVVFLITRTDKVANLNGSNTFCAVLAAEERLKINRFYLDSSEDPAQFQAP